MGFECVGAMVKAWMRKGSIDSNEAARARVKGVWNSSAQAKDPLTEVITQQDNVRAEEACGFSVVKLCFILGYP